MNIKLGKLTRTLALALFEIKGMLKGTRVNMNTTTGDLISQD